MYPCGYGQYHRFITDVNTAAWSRGGGYGTRPLNPIDHIDATRVPLHLNPLTLSAADLETIAEPYYNLSGPGRNRLNRFDNANGRRCDTISFHSAMRNRKRISSPNHWI